MPTTTPAAMAAVFGDEVLLPEEAPAVAVTVWPAYQIRNCSERKAYQTTTYLRQ
jgi:hypothetical protein